jgi:hypothetical protein
MQQLLSSLSEFYSFLIVSYDPRTITLYRTVSFLRLILIACVSKHMLFGYLFVCLCVSFSYLPSNPTMRASAGRNLDSRLMVLRSKRFSVDPILPLVLTGEPVSLIRFLDWIA